MGSPKKSKGAKVRAPPPATPATQARGGAVTLAEARARLATCEEAMLQGCTRAQIHDVLAKAHGMSRWSCDKAIRKVRDRWTRETTADLQQKRAAAIHRLESLASSARLASEYGAAVQAEKLRAQIEGTLAPTKVELVDPTGFDPSLYTPEGIAAVKADPKRWKEILDMPGMRKG